MLEHHIQRNIVYRLAFSDSLSFTQLKPELLENKLFTYHLKKVEKSGLIIKNDEGKYTLTPEGRRLGIRALDNKDVLIDRPESILILVVRRQSDKSWMLYKRKVHPLKDLSGFMHCRPNGLEPSKITAAKALLDNTGLTGSFDRLGGGYFRVFREGQLESFTHFSMMVCSDATGELSPTDEFADYYWADSPDFDSPDMLPNMQILGEYYDHGETFYIEETLEL